MTTWKNLAGKFTLEEIEIIKNFQKKLQLNDNQFIRTSVEVMVFYLGNMIKLADSKVDKKIEKEYKEIQKEIAKYPELNAKVQPFLEKMGLHYDQTIKQIIKESKPEIKKFTKKRVVGRPKSRKKKRGRPADTGI